MKSTNSDRENDEFEPNYHRGPYKEKPRALGGNRAS